MAIQISRVRAGNSCLRVALWGGPLQLDCAGALSREADHGKC